MLNILVTSSASSRVSLGRMEGRLRASSVLPLPGGPLMSRLCPPAAATSIARLACSWPRMSAMFTPPRQPFADTKPLLSAAMSLAAGEILGPPFRW